MIQRAGAGSLAGRGPSAAVAIALALMGGPAQAQFSRYADEIELKRLDFHPRPSVRNEMGTRFYGVIDLGVATGRAEDEPCGDELKPNPSRRVAGAGPSFLGIRSDELLNRGWRAHVQLEHGFDADEGQRASIRCNDATFWDRRASVGLSHRDYGRLDIGRLEHPARQIAFLASPWGPDSVASPGEKGLYLPADAKRQTLPGRSNQAVTWQSPDSVNYQLQLHASRAREPDGSDERPASTKEQHGASFVAWLGPWHAGIGYQRWDSGNHALPVAVVYTLGHARLFGGLVAGEREGRSFRSASLGWAWRERSGPHPGEWKLGLNLLEQDHQRRRWKLGAGFERPLSRRTSWQANVGAQSGDPTASRVRFDLGLRHAFAP